VAAILFLIVAQHHAVGLFFAGLPAEENLLFANSARFEVRSPSYHSRIFPEIPPRDLVDGMMDALIGDLAKDRGTTSQFPTSACITKDQQILARDCQELKLTQC
jgi:hypothetical protein